MTHEEFEQLVREGIDAVDPKFLALLKNVDIVVEESPLSHQKPGGGLLFGLYEGIPQTQRQQYGQVLPDKITIFKNEIEAAYSSPEDIKRAVRDTVWHEIAHHFGMDEHQVRKAENSRRKKI